MKTYLLKTIYTTLLFICFTGLTTIEAQCYSSSLSKNPLEFPLNGGYQTTTVSFPSGGCDNPTISVYNVPSWLTVNVSGYTIQVTAQSLSSGYREASIPVRANGNTVNGFIVKQGTEPPPPPPEPCSVSGFSGGTFNPFGETKNYNLSFSNCSSSTATFSFTTSSGQSIPSWISISQTGTSISVTCNENNTGNTRTVILVGRANVGGDDVAIGEQISQLSCSKTWYKDVDNDGYAELTRVECASPGSGYSTTVKPLGDCNDSNASINPDTKWYKDADGDGFAATVKTQCASPGSGYTRTVKPLGDCNDSNASINPDTKWYKDADGDGFAATVKTQCTSPGTGYTRTVKPLGDCNDSSAAINPDTKWYKDADGDGFAATVKTQCASPGSGYTRSVKPLGDCNDSSAAINPDTKWYKDADGDGFAATVKTQCMSPGTGYTRTVKPLGDCNDSNVAINPDTKWYKDADGDGFAATVKTQCVSPGSGYTRTVKPTGDCNDNNASLNPDTTWYLDADGDGYAVSTKTQCTSPGAGYGTTTKPLGDCNDGNPSLNPDATWYADTDGDGYGDPNAAQSACDRPTGYVSNDDDHDDSTELITNIPPQNFYRDADGDGFGEPGDTVYQSVKPSGYVTNNNDQCPDEYGDNNGCPYEEATLSNENYIYTRTYQSPMTAPGGINENSDVIEQVTYFDGLGRPMQQVGIKASPGSQDIVTHIGYDDYGRQDKEWLPYMAGGTIGNYRGMDPDGKTQTYYESHYPDDVVQGSANPYSEKVFEPSPLNRVLKQAAPGESWKKDGGHEIEFSYDINVVNEVRLFQVGFVNGDTEAPELEIDTVGHYLAGELYKTVTKDENWQPGDGNLHTTEEFKDKQGRAVLKRTYGPSDINMDGSISAGESEVQHDTYYVYDLFGNLTYVLPPKINATTANIATLRSNLNALGYQYKYDEQNRLVKKKIPGKGWEHIVYNRLDQPVLAQDANQRDNNEWLFTKYDAFGRVAYTGIVQSIDDRTAMQASADAFSTQFETQTATASTYAGTPVHYTKQAFPDSFSEVLTVNYYDTYVDTDGLTVPSQVYGEPKATGIETKGLPTVSKVKVLDDDSPNTWTTTITGYDKKGRAIYTAEQNDYLNTTTINESDLDFTGKVLVSKTKHRKGTGTWIVTIDNYTYDHRGRLVDHYQCIGEGSSFEGCDDTADYVNKSYSAPLSETTIKEASGSFTLQPGFHFVASSGKTLHLSIAQKGELIAHNVYDNLGQLKTKKVGNTESTPLQTVSYDYNIRGWLKKINAPSSLGTSLFGFEIRYNDIADTDKKLFNGNISQTLWNTQSENSTSNPVSNQYTYSYDALNRITGATDNTGNYNVSGIAYDQNGNITALERQGHTAMESNGEITAYGQMDALTYTYGVGNKLTKVLDDGNDTYGFKDGNTGTDYDYDANGNLTQDLNKGIPTDGITYNHLNLPASITIGGGNISYIYDATGVKLKKTVSTGKVTEYAGNYIYENNQLQFFSHAEGYVTPNSNGYDYVYQYKDHLGNVRLSYMDANSNGSITGDEIIEESNYYPFGLQHKGYGPGISSLGNDVAKKFKYQGQELTKSLGYEMYEFELRHYDAAIGRFITTDPYEQFHSPYMAMGNNPVVSFDPDGGKCYDGNGNVVACPDSEIYDDYRESDEKHITVLGEVEVSNSDSNFDKGKREFLRSEDVQVEKFMNVHVDEIAMGVVLMATTTSQLDGPEPGPADVAAVGELLTGAMLISLLIQSEDFVNENHALITQSLNYIPPPKTLPGFPGATKVKRKNERARWHLPNGDIGEWDSQHGELEVYDKTGKKHKGAYDPDTGEKKKDGDPKRKTDKK
ncbi:DUF6443 domain-containing protein [Galbibacter sp. EGI 63066]|uniref:DUF6443 domain-containing protein n=1 Tax=Galbibacter sp. EGI 63066 TaxID=2993559 RepID=UPI0022499535|nr:DUF6443 domain-containing protein [Galbibacter sp. EGI 63066]MCX2679369.1 DUF6443 domain-containing protein [Galbibacter sp. EGI 63066]